MLRKMAIALLLLPVLQSGLVAEELTDKNYKTTRDHILPKPEEIEWRKIEWRATIWQGVIDAQKEDKPVLLYTMNGHPFGCT